jgi:hypothetical protein
LCSTGWRASKSFFSCFVLFENKASISDSIRDYY